MYILIEDNTAIEIIPDVDPAFPDIPIEKRYSPSFLNKLQHFSDDTAVEQNWSYDPETQTFSEPEEPEPIEPETISTDELDAAYKEGVNSVG